MESQTTSSGFQETLEPIRSIATSEAEKGHLFERLMKAYFAQDPLYRDRFAGGLAVVTTELHKTA